MAHWMIWAVAAGILVILELFSGTFYLLMVALGTAAGALAAWLGWSDAMQFLIAAGVGVVATVALHRSDLGGRRDKSAKPDRIADLDIGQHMQIDAWTIHGDGSASARGMYRGARWDVDFEGSEAPQPGTFQIVAIRGSRLLVAPGLKA